MPNAVTLQLKKYNMSNGMRNEDEIDLNIQM
jgi:hypothetical protein